MILQALYRLAQQENLMGDPDFEPKPISWLIGVNEAGKCTGIRGTHHVPPNQEGTRRKPRPFPQNYFVPREGIRTSGDRAFFLYDKAEYVFGRDPDGKQKDPGKSAKRFGLFKERVKACLDATQDEGIRAVYTFLDDLQNRKQSIELPDDCKGNDLFAFVFGPDTDQLATNRERVRDYWHDLRSKKSGGKDTAYHCLVSGERCEEIGLFPSIKRVPGGQSSGTALVSFNASAFLSHGWKSNENAPISRDVAEACATSLNRLLHPAYPDPEQPSQTLSQRHIRINANTVVGYWSEESETDGFTSIFSALLEANPEKVRTLYQSIWRGVPIEIDENAPFYALTLSGAQGRIIIRDWFESTINTVQQNLAEYFSDLEIARNTPKPRDRELPPQLPLHVLLESLAPFGKRDEIPPHLAGQFLRAALTGTPFPFSVLQRAIQRERAEIGKQTWSDMERRDARAALIKAVLNRRHRFSQTRMSFPEATRDMDLNNTAPGYLLGRLMAVIERMQQLAIGDPNASVVDRYFSGASASPAAVYPRLLKNLRHHARKAKDEPKTAGTARWLDTQVDAIIAHLPTFPAHLNIEQQGLFVLGYHHQRSELWKKKEERETA